MIYIQNMEKRGDSELNSYSDLIGLIYDAAEEPALWPALLLELEGFLGENCDETETNSAYLPEPHKKILEPHFHRAIKINRRIHQLEKQNLISTGILDRLPIAVIITNKEVIPIAMNDRAKQLLAHNQELRIKAGTIITNSSCMTKKLHGLIRAGSIDLQSAEGNSLMISDSNNGNNTSIWITSSSLSSIDLNDSELITLYISSPLIRPEFDVVSLQQNFNLSIAEARLVKTLVNGCHNLNEAADKLELSIHTVRTQIKSVFEKTGTGNQVELVKKVLTDPSILIGNTQQTKAYVCNKGDYPGNCSSIKLYDGRRLAYAEYGDPKGRPVFLLHGIAGSRLQYPANDTTAMTLGLRFIIPDRPGHGLSDQLEDRSLLDWPDDLIQLAKQLGIAKFSILSYSGGCSYALACAHKIPEYIEKISMITARGPIDSFSDILSIDGAILRLARHMPALLSRYMRIMLADVVQDPIKVLEKRSRHFSHSDKRCIENHPQQQQMYADALAESARQGPDGITHDIIVAMQPCEFSIKEIQSKIRLWHGVEDKSIPLRAARKLADELPDCDAIFVPNIGGMLIIQHWDEILTDLAEGLCSS